MKPEAESRTTDLTSLSCVSMVPATQEEEDTDRNPVEDDTDSNAASENLLDDLGEDADLTDLMQDEAMPDPQPIHDQFPLLTKDVSSVIGPSQENVPKQKENNFFLAATNYSLVAMEQTGVVTSDISLDSKRPNESTVSPIPGTSAAADDSMIQTPKRSKLTEPDDYAALSSPIISRSSQSLNVSSLRLELDDSSAAVDSPVISKAGAAKSGSLTSALFDSMGLESDAEEEEVNEEIMKVMEGDHNDDDKDPGKYIFHNESFFLY